MEFLEAPPLPLLFHARARTVSRHPARIHLARDHALRRRVGRGRDLPRELYARAAELGVQGLGYPEAYGGTPADVFFQLIVAEEFARCGGAGCRPR